MLAELLALQIATSTPSADPFAFFRPSVTITPDERAQLDRGQSIARTLRGQDLEVAVLAIVSVHIDSDRLIAWMRRIEALKKSSYVVAIGRFSDPPRLEDLAGLALDDDDLSAIRSCRPGSCRLKLSASEMTQLQKAAAVAEGDWKVAIQNAFRRSVLARVQAYLADGHVAPYDDQQDSVRPATRFGAILDHSRFLAERVPRFAQHLRGYPSTIDPRIESFLYWSKERITRKAIISVTHVSMARGDQPGLPEVLVAAKEIFSTHYINASLGVTALMRGEAGGPNYLVYVNRSEVDMLHGMFGGLIRSFMQRRLKTEAANVLQGLRRRLESGEPPPVLTVSP